MTRTEQIRREQELAEQARPLILERLRVAREPLAIAKDVAGRVGVDETTAYRWVAYVAEDFERRRKRISLLGLALLWPGALLLAGGPLLSLLGVSPGGVSLWLIGLVAGLPLGASGAVIAVRARHFVRETL